MAATVTEWSSGINEGRLVIPAELRQEMSLSAGDVLLAAVEGQRLVLEKREAVLERVKRRFSHIPPDVSLADELIAERRAGASPSQKTSAAPL